MLRLFFASLAFFSLISLSAQDFRPGYIIRNSGDTVRGFCQFKIGSGKHDGCVFRKDKTQTTETLQEADISEYGFETGEVYQYEPTLKKFALVLFKGPVSALKVESVYFVVKEGVPHELKNTSRVIRREGMNFLFEAKEFQGTLNWLFSDCPKVSGQIKRSELSDKSLFNLIKSYNLCKGFSYAKASQKKRPSELQIGTLFFYNVSSVSNLSPSTNVTNETKGVYTTVQELCTTSMFQNKASVSYGLSFVFFPASTGGKVSIATEIQFQSLSFSGQYSYTKNSSLVYVNNLSENMSLVKVPLSIRYNIKKYNQKVYPFINLGVSFASITNNGSSDMAVLSNSSYGGVQYEAFRWNNIFQNNGLSVSVLGGCGIQFDFGRLATSLQFRFERGQGPFRFYYPFSPNPVTTLTTISGGVNLSYKL